MLSDSLSNIDFNTIIIHICICRRQNEHHNGRCADPPPPPIRAAQGAAAATNTAASSDDAMHLKGIVFDMDGTLCIPPPPSPQPPSPSTDPHSPSPPPRRKGEPQNYMFGEMRAALAIPPDTDILDHVHRLAEPQQTEAFDTIQAIERTAMAQQVPQAGLVTLMEFLDRHGIRKAICTRNFDTPVNHLLEKNIPSHVDPFSPIVTREFRPPKPSPAGILHIAHAWGLTEAAAVPASPPEARRLPLIMVGDSVDDMAAGRDAGALTVLLRSRGKEALERDERTDVVVGRLDELIALLEEGLQAR
ncbi:putative hydrolase [Teratosphaeria destructans]|uniref:Hydrolase n=1 Tax=Teratosphaeria destructans TaxID=418781 RepID=A0A9W7W0W6_9PEZI|nr:putative hydrolase [Teratosphaeria destructans]